MSNKIDQATKLRSLAQTTKGSAVLRDRRKMKIITVCSGQPDAGVTSVCLNLAVCLASQGQRIVLVDGAMSKENKLQTSLTNLCRLSSTTTIDDVLTSRSSIHEVLLAGPLGMQVLPGFATPGCVPDCSPAAQEHLITELESLQKHVDLVIVDAGCGITQVMRRYWQASDAVMAVVTPHNMAIMETYGMIKSLHDANAAAWIGTLVNNVADFPAAAQIHLRLHEALHRFCHFKLHNWGWMMSDEIVTQSATARESWWLSNQEPAIAKQLSEVAHELLARLPNVPERTESSGTPSLFASNGDFEPLTFAEFPVSV